MFGIGTLLNTGTAYSDRVFHRTRIYKVNIIYNDKNPRADYCSGVFYFNLNYI